ncbi:MAG: IclR family transcriptional regulator [Actinomycetes bacterium]
MTGARGGQQANAGGVQSVRRAFELLETLAEGGPMSLSQLSSSSGLPLTTIHRLTGTLVGLGYLRQQSAKQYALGPRLIHLGERSGLLLSTWAIPHLARLVDELGETANLAMLEGDEIVYVAQAPSRHSMRMFTEVGRHVLPHCTAVGKALLAQLPAEQVEGIVRRTGMQAQTANTITSPERLAEELDVVRRQGFAIDDGEQEVGVHCVAVALTDGSPRLALSVSGPVPRMTDDLVRRAVPLLNRTARALADDLATDR